MATRPPWTCSCCGVTCTSEETLIGHANGKKHRSKARSARARAAGEDPDRTPEPVAEEKKTKKVKKEKKAKKVKKEKKRAKESDDDSGRKEKKRAKKN